MESPTCSAQTGVRETDINSQQRILSYPCLPFFTATLKSSTTWLEAISQNAWDTGKHVLDNQVACILKVLLWTLGGGSGSFLTYASFMKRSQGAVRLGTITPVCNNVVSLMCGILIFSTVFSVQKGQGESERDILATLRYNGPGNSGLTFIW
jgi:NSS family neurotransmitter:Na+ symporter